MNHPFPLGCGANAELLVRISQAGSLLLQSMITAMGVNQRQVNGRRSSVSDVGGDESVSAYPVALPMASPHPRSHHFRLIHVWNTFRGIINPLLFHSNDACTGAHASVFPLITSKPVGTGTFNGKSSGSFNEFLLYPVGRQQDGPPTWAWSRSRFPPVKRVFVLPLMLVGEGGGHPLEFYKILSDNLGRECTNRSFLLELKPCNRIHNMLCN